MFGIKRKTRLILASKSPRRAEILRNAGFAFEVHATHADESRRPRESARNFVHRLATEKARLAAAHANRRSHPAIVLGADTVVVSQGNILGKPSDVREARKMLRRLSGKTHLVLTGISIVSVPGGAEWHHVEATRVRFLKMSEAEIDDYIATGEPFDKAGAYGIQGIGGRFVARVEGCYFNVMGLPISRVWTLLRAAGWTDSKS
jgi:septum formation protein